MRTSIRVLCFILAMVAGAAASHAESVEALLVRLDSLVAGHEQFAQAKQARIDGIKRESIKVNTDEERYWFNRRLYDEYFVFDADSAMSYVNANLRLAAKAGNRAWQDEWHIKRSFILSVMGLLKDAEEELAAIDLNTMSEELRHEYYAQMAYLYSHLGQLSDHRNVGREDYDAMSSSYQDSTYNTISNENPEYLWHKGSAHYDRPDENTPALIAELKTVVDGSSQDTRLDAINAYVLSRLYGDVGDNDNKLRYLIVSGCIDVATANRDIASLEELADILIQQGDIERAYNYINYCRQQAIALPNRVRAASLSRTEAVVHQLYVDKLQATGASLQLTLRILIGVLALVVLMAILLINRSHRLKRSKRQLSESNAKLEANIGELSASRAQLEETLAELRDANTHIQQINHNLSEANNTKERCIGATFALCSSYIDRLENFRRTVGRLVRSNSWNELRAEVAAPSLTTDELKEFYRSFDKHFLEIYPDFVDDFNGLLRPDQRITVAPGQLNMELRIYALVRLGIADSVTIAAMLHCSPQTVYNYRLRTRNKAAIPKETFAETVKKLGK